MQELAKAQDLQVKTAAAEKLLFLINLRVEGVNQAAFNIIEIMGSTSSVRIKQIAYLIAPCLL